MCIGGNDIVNLPTQTNGLPLADLGLAPLPAGPDGKQYSSFVGSAYIFSKDASEEQINAALDYITIMGKGPVPEGDMFEAECKSRKENGIPVICQFPDWINQTKLDQEAAVIEKYSNVDMRLYQDYFDIVKKEGNLRLSEPGIAEEMYRELTSVLQAVIIDKNADVASYEES
jgi:hypothetical protein